MKLYRGLKTKDFSLRTPQEEQEYKNKWRKILKLRKKDDFSYPEELNKDIIKLYKKSKLSYQHFTDREKTAERYAKGNEGSIIEIDVSVDDILEYFTLEFQNYQKRREKFEIVYVVPSAVLLEKQDEWSLQHVEM